MVPTGIRAASILEAKSSKFGISDTSELKAEARRTVRQHLVEQLLDDAGVLEALVHSFCLMRCTLCLLLVQRLVHNRCRDLKGVGS